MSTAFRTNVPGKWQILNAVEEAREPLGLKGTSLAILRAMVSFVGSDQITDTRDDTHVCFASNAALAGRSHVSVQTVERHIARLVSLGLLTRRASGNGKRWARRDGQGNVVLATGLSLLPLVQRHGELLQLGQRHTALKHELSLIRDRCRLAIAALKSRARNLVDLEPLLTRARNLLRRNVRKAALEELLADISVEISQLNQSETEDLRARPTRYEGHKETNLSPSVKKETFSKVDVSPDQMEQSFPRLCQELRFGRNQTDCDRIMDDLAAQLCLGDTWFDIKALGPALQFMLLGYLLQRVTKLQNPRGYAKSLVDGLAQGTVSWQTFLQKPQRVSERSYHKPRDARSTQAHALG